MDSTKLGLSSKQIVGLAIILCLIGGGLCVTMFVVGPALLTWNDKIPLGNASAAVAGSLACTDADGNVLMVAPVRDFLTPTGDVIYQFAWGINYTLTMSSGAAVVTPVVRLHVEADVIGSTGSLVTVVVADESSAEASGVFSGVLAASVLDLPASSPEGSYFIMFTFEFDAQASVNGEIKNTVGTYTAKIAVTWQVTSAGDDLQLDARPWLDHAEHRELR